MHAANNIVILMLAQTLQQKGDSRCCGAAGGGGSTFQSASWPSRWSSWSLAGGRYAPGAVSISIVRLRSSTGRTPPSPRHSRARRGPQNRECPGPARPSPRSNTTTASSARPASRPPSLPTPARLDPWRKADRERRYRTAVRPRQDAVPGPWRRADGCGCARTAHPSPPSAWDVLADDAARDRIGLDEQAEKLRPRDNASNPSAPEPANRSITPRNRAGPATRPHVSKHIEDRLTRPVRRRARALARRRNHLSSAIGATDNPHSPYVPVSRSQRLGISHAGRASKAGAPLRNGG